MRMKEERIYKKIIHTKMLGKRPRERLKTKQKGYINDRGNLGIYARKQEVGEWRQLGISL